MSPRGQTGFTLIELLLYVVIVGTLLTAVTLFFALSADARIKNQSITEVNDQGTHAIEHIAQTTRNALNLTSPAIGSTGTQLTVSVPTGTLSPTIYNLSGTTLMVKEGAATAVALTNSKVQATALTVKNLSRANTPGVVQVSLTLSRTNPENRSEYSYTKTFTTSVSLRP